MICLKTFENKTNKDFNSWSDWVKFTKENYNYALSKSTIKDFKSKCKSIDLPSYHPYWKLIAKLRLRKHYFRIIGYYKECLIDNSKIKYYFNISTTMLDIENKINEMKQKIYYD